MAIRSNLTVGNIWWLTILQCHNISDVIWENLPYGGANIVGPGQMWVMRSVRSVSSIFVADDHLKWTFCCCLCSFNHKYYHKSVKTADLGGHCLFLHKAGFHRWTSLFWMFIFIDSAKWEKSYFCRCSHLTKRSRHWPGIVQKAHRLIRACSFCASISWDFPSCSHMFVPLNCVDWS